MPYEGMLAETVTIQGNDGDAIEAYYARPLAYHGYCAINPNLYHRAGLGSPDDVAAKVRAGGGVPDDQVMGDLAGAIAFLRAQPYANGKVGMIGFCSGG